MKPTADSSGKLPLHWAVILPGFDDDTRVDLVRGLLEARADPNCRDADTFGLRIGGMPNRDLSSKCGGKTPLHHLCGSMRESTHTMFAVETLLKHRADLVLKDFDGNTPARLAQMRRNTQTVALLGAPQIDNVEAAAMTAAYANRCTEREKVWERGGREAKLRMRHAFLSRLAADYSPLHSSLYTLSDHEAFFEPSFIEALRLGTRKAFESVRDFKQLSEGLYQYRIFREEVCLQLMQEVDHFNAFADAAGIEVSRPNSMNRYGLLLNDIGFLKTLNQLMCRFVQPLASAFFSERLGGDFHFESQHSFIVRYKMGEDLDLKTHRDDSDITLNICLGKDFDGARLYFHRDGEQCECVASGDDGREEFSYPHPAACRFCTCHYDHTPGVGLMHTGNHVHGVERLKRGERSNLVIWCRRRGYPEELCEELGEAPVKAQRRV